MSAPAQSRRGPVVTNQPGGNKSETSPPRSGKEVSFDGQEELRRAVTRALPEICALIKRKTGHDFTRYKQSTLARRVLRRVSLVRVETVEEYLARLQHDPKEIEHLFNDLLIGVTQFFRDPEAFEALQAKVIPQLYKRPASAGPIRVWVSGCATGEEAYSIAILLSEHAEKLKAPVNAMVFATDLDGEALDMARKGEYSSEAMENVSAERARKYFQQKNDGYEVRKEVREICIFSPHSIVKDPPFSRLDLISCRNLLIYFEMDLQRRLLPLFHFALNPGGFLFLGPSENVAIRSQLFQAVDTRNRIFQRKPALSNAPVYPPNLERSHSVPMHSMPQPSGPPSKDHATTRTIERVLLEEYAPASVVVNEHGETLFFSGHTGRFLQHQAGAPTTKLLDMARGDLRMELRTALQHAISTRQEVTRRNIAIKVGKYDQHVDLVVRPLIELGRDAGLFIVVFQEVPLPDASAKPIETVTESDRAVISQLESELRTTREDLQTTIEELETSNEELKSANEELLSMNEELQSTNEELQTSKEEIQSINEELQKKVEELDAAHNDLQNFFESTQVPTLFLDGQLRIKKFSKAMEPICRLSQADVGKQLNRVAPDCIHPDLPRFVEEVLRTGEQREREIAVATDGWHLMRVAPYHATDNSVQGVVITFPDITALKKSQEQSSLLAAIVEGSQDGVIGKSLEGIITSWNAAATRMYGYTAEQAIGKPISMLAPPNRVAEFPQLFDRIRRGETIKAFETERVTRAGKVLTISLTLSPIRNDRGEVVGVSGIDRDITGEKAAQERQARLAAIVDSSNDAIMGKTLDGIITTWNAAAERIYGYTAEEMIGHSIMAIIPPDRREEELGILASLRSGKGFELYETARIRKDGRRIDISLTSSPLRNANGEVIGASTISRDITEQKQAQAALAEAQRRLKNHAEELERLVHERTVNLEETIESLEGVCYTIAHDLRAPLRAVQSFTEVLLEDYGSKFDKQGKEFAERIVAAATRMDLLINDLLAYAKLTHSQLPLEPLDLNDEMKRVRDRLAVEITAQHGELTFGKLPTVLANQIVLDQVFANLISNGLKFVAPGTKPKIEVGAQELNDGLARIYVQDNGIGIPEEHRERVFGLFQRLHHEEYPGTGVGLAIVKKGVERMGGRVAIEQPENGGTRFVMDLPLAKRE
jgi:two-component system CheB/CheR fusion protein